METAGLTGTCTLAVPESYSPPGNPGELLALLLITCPDIFPVMGQAQRKAVRGHRRRQRGKGLARVEVQTPDTDVAMIREVAAVLRSGTQQADELRAKLREALVPREGNLIDLLACELPDSLIDEALARRDDRGRKVTL
jgi:hypothetical protein